MKKNKAVGHADKNLDLNKLGRAACFHMKSV